MFTKVCGLTKEEHIDWAIALGYSAIGIVLYPPSPRYCDADQAKRLALYARGKIITVAVSVAFLEVEKVAPHFDYVQLYELANIPNLIYAGQSVSQPRTWAYFLYDTSRGSGIFHALPEWLTTIRDRLIISGGLTAANIEAVIRQFQPFGVDVSSGVEIERGVKDFNLMKKFIKEVRDASK